MTKILPSHHFYDYFVAEMTHQHHFQIPESRIVIIRNTLKTLLVVAGGITLCYMPFHFTNLTDEFSKTIVLSTLFSSSYLFCALANSCKILRPFSSSSV